MHAGMQRAAAAQGLAPHMAPRTHTPADNHAALAYGHGARETASVSNCPIRTHRHRTGPRAEGQGRPIAALGCCPTRVGFPKACGPGAREVAALSSFSTSCRSHQARSRLMSMVKGIYTSAGPVRCATNAAVQLAANALFSQGHPPAFVSTPHCLHSRALRPEAVQSDMHGAGDALGREAVRESRGNGIESQGKARQGKETWLLPRSSRVISSIVPSHV